MDLLMLAHRKHAGGGKAGLCQVTLPPTPQSPEAARQVLVACLGPLGGLSTLVSLVASELVTNAVVHAGTDIRFSVSLDEGGQSALVEVHDDVALGPRRLRAGRLSSGRATRGRGLAMVRQLASKWGVRREAGGKTVWALVPLEVEHPVS